MRLPLFYLTCLTALTGMLPHLGAETLPPLKDGKIPQDLNGLWGDFDPRKEPLEVENTREWEQDGVTCGILRYTVGIFNPNSEIGL